MIVHPYAVVDPGTVVIKPFNTSVANRTVFTPRVLRTSQSGHISQGCTFERISMNSNSGRMKPGSFTLAIMKDIASMNDNIVKAYAKNVVS